MDFKKMSKESLEEMQNQIEQAIKEKENELVMRLEVGDDYLHVFIGHDIIAFIDPNGKFTIGTGRDETELINKWHKSGMRYSDSRVNFKGGEYKLYNNRLRRVDISECLIYDFEHMESIVGCKDQNVKRYDNGTVIVY